MSDGPHESPDGPAASSPVITASTLEKPAGHIAFTYPDFRWFQLGRVLLVLTVEAQSVAVGWQVYQITHRALDLGYVGLAQFLPVLLLVLVSGHAADRFDRRTVMLVCTLGACLCSSLLLWATLRGWHVYGILAVLLGTGIVRSFYSPAVQAYMTHLVPREHFQNAVAWSSSLFTLAIILGPALGGLLYAVGGSATLVYAVAIPTLLMGALAVARVRTRTGRMEQRSVSLQTALAGFAYIWRKKLILGATTLDLFAVLLGGAVALLPMYAESVLHVGPAGLGLLRSAPAIGAGAMAALMAYRPLRRRAGGIMLGCVALFGLATIGFGLTTHFLISMLFLLLAGASDMVSVVVRGTLVQLETPPEMRGRVNSVNMLFIGTSNEFGEFESGLTAQWLGAVRAVVWGGIGTLLVVALWTPLFPELRRAHLD